VTSEVHPSSIPAEDHFLFNVPCAWLGRALALGLRVARVAHVLLWRSSLVTHAEFACPHRLLAIWGIRDVDVRPAVRALETAGLIRVIPGQGRTRSSYQLVFGAYWEERFVLQRSRVRVKAKTSRREGKAAEEPKSPSQRSVNLTDDEDEEVAYEA